MPAKLLNIAKAEYLTLIRQYGTKDAMLMAKRCDALLELGDLDGRRVWKDVLRAVGEWSGWSGRWMRPPVPITAQPLLSSDIRLYLPRGG